MTDEELKRRFDAIDKQFEGVATKVDLDQLGKSIDQGFGAVQEQFAAVHEQFAAVHEQFAAVHEQFAAVHEQFGALDRRLDGFATKLDLDHMSVEIRNHFDVVAEAFKAEVRVIADGHRALRATDTELIGAHQRLERRQDRLELRQLALETRRRTPKSDRGQ